MKQFDEMNYKIRVPDASLGRDIDLGPLADAFHFVNLTNGLEAVPHLTRLQLPFQLSRCASRCRSA